MSLLDQIENDNAMILADWGVTATFDVSGIPTAVTGLFNNAPVRTVQLYDGSIEATGPSFSFLTSALTPTHGQDVTIADLDYTVNGIDRDGLGWTTIQLREA